MKKFLIISLLFIKVSAEEINPLENLSIENYDINFDKNIYEYKITIEDESNLKIDYDLSEDVYVSITGNGNFNKSDNIIEINVDNKYKYTIHAYKTIKVSKIEKTEYKEMSNKKKEIALFLIITISSILIFIFSYITFIKN